jgi:hypothetical protein
MDTFYCDPDIAGVDCTGWLGGDLFDPPNSGSNRPLVRMVMAVLDPGLSLLSIGVSGTDGAYSMSFTLPSCAGSAVWAIAYYIRSANATWNGDGLFELVDNGGNAIALAVPVALTGATTTVDAAATPTTSWTSAS